MSASESEYRIEHVPVCPGQIRTTFLRGKHADACARTIDGWICAPGCTIETMKVVNQLRHTVDSLVEVVPERRFTWRLKPFVWSLTRVSNHRLFVNGFSRRDDFAISYDVWHKGRAWTPWGANRALRATLEMPHS